VTRHHNTSTSEQAFAAIEKPYFAALVYRDLA